MKGKVFPLVPEKDSRSSVLPLLQEFLILSSGPPAQDQLLEAKIICSLSVLRAGIVGLERNHRGSCAGQDPSVPAVCWCQSSELPGCGGRSSVPMKVVYVCFFLAKAPNCQHIFSAYTCQLHQFSWHCTAFMLSYGFIAA